MVKAVNADPSDSNQKLTTTNTYVLVGAIWAAAVDLSHLATVIYAGIIYHRHRISTRTALFQSLSIQNRSNTQQCYEEGSGVATADHQASLSPSARTYTEGGLLSPLAEQESYAAIGLLEGQSRNGIGPVESGGSAASPLEHGSHGAGPFETDGLAVRGAMQEIPPEGAERYEMAAYEDVPGSKLRWEKH
ncbi:MAG: hypothetical protein M1827_003749 [Pycnora praestabilis]|nr:MAG: hypothetical protein M1827_003749 [Pycnora praestabilis]